MKLTPEQKKVVKTLTKTGWSIRRDFSYGGLHTYYWDAPTLQCVDARVFNCLRSKGLIEEHDRALGLWRLSKAGRDTAAAQGEVEG